MEGWISIHRTLQSHWLWEDEPFSKGQAWVDILLMVNFTDKMVMLGTELIEVKRGSRITSIRKLCERWGWSNTKVKAFLKTLEKDKMIVVKSDSKKTTLTVVKYNDYQRQNTKENVAETSEKRQRNVAETSEKHTNNKENKENKENKVNNDNNTIYIDVIDYLNLKANKSYKHTTKKTKDLIRARQHEGFTLEDFKKVIDNKVLSWTNTEWEKYLRPETLLGTKFESYLNEEVKEATNGNFTRNDSTKPKYDTEKYNWTGNPD